MLKRKLNDLLLETNLPRRVPKVTKEYIEASQKVRDQIKTRMNLPLATFLRTAPEFNAKHGLVYKLLKTSRERLNSSTLCSHDVMFWLRDHKNPVAASWIIKLAGPEVGQVSRNQMLQWLFKQGKNGAMKEFYVRSKKWGFNDTDVTLGIMANPGSPSEAREIYRTAKLEDKKSKQTLANKLLKDLTLKKDINMEDTWGFFKTISKDLVTFQIMLGAMVKHSELRSHLDSLWLLAKRQEDSNNIQIDDKLRETYERVLKLTRAKRDGGSRTSPDP